MSQFGPPRTRRPWCLEARRPWNFDPTFGEGRRGLRTKWKEFALTGIAIHFSYEVKWKPEVESDLISRSTENGGFSVNRKWWFAMATAAHSRGSRSPDQSGSLPATRSHTGLGDWGPKREPEDLGSWPLWGSPITRYGLAPNPPTRGVPLLSPRAPQRAIWDGFIRGWVLSII